MIHILEIVLLNSTLAGKQERRCRRCRFAVETEISENMMTATDKQLNIREYIVLVRIENLSLLLTMIHHC